VNAQPTYDPDLMRFLGSGYAPKAAQDSPKKPWKTRTGRPARSSRVEDRSRPMTRISRAIAIALSYVPHLRCLVSGHDGRVERRRGWLYLRCVRCDRVSPGIQVR
jgi:hypothetical protein